MPAERGVCTDVVVRALRSARALDLQKLVHEDMSAHFRDYPNQPRWGQREARRQHRSSARAEPHDLVSARPVTARRHHARPRTIYPVTSWPGTWAADSCTSASSATVRAVTGVPLVIHNIGAGAREEDILFRFAIIGHYRLPAP